MAESFPGRPHSIATRKGDDGTTSLLYGQRVSKDHPQIEAVGALDELTVHLGFAKLAQPGKANLAEFERIQQELVAFMGEVACAESDATRYSASQFNKLDDGALVRLDAAVAVIEARQPKFDGWATPGANPYSVALDLARTSARRAERRLASLNHHGRILRPLLLHYINRLSDLLWLKARETEN